MLQASLPSQYDVVLESGTVCGTGGTRNDQQIELVLDTALPNTDTAALQPLMVQDLLKGDLESGPDRTSSIVQSKEVGSSLQ